MSYRDDLYKIKMGLMPKTTGPKPKKPLKRVSDKKKAEDAEKKAKGSDSELDRFFDAMIKRCTGKCLFCREKTTAVSHDFYRDDNEKWGEEANQKKHERSVEALKRASVAHIFPKAKFPSVATHEDNWLELCWSCHTSLDSGNISWLTVRDSKEWDVVKEKLLNVLPLIAEEERKHKLYSRLEKLVYETN